MTISDIILIAISEESSIGAVGSEPSSNRIRATIAPVASDCEWVKFDPEGWGKRVGLRFYRLPIPADKKARRWFRCSLEELVEDGLIERRGLEDIGPSWVRLTDKGHKAAARAVKKATTQAAKRNRQPE